VTCIDRARLEYEPLVILKFFRGPHDFRSKKISAHGSGETLSEKLYFSENFYK
jgi:hypothetical protein